MLVKAALKRLAVVNHGNISRLKYFVHPRRLNHDIGKILHHIEPYNPPQKVELSNQAVLLPGPERIRASRFSDDPTKVYDEVPGSPHIKNVFDFLDHGLKLSNDGHCAGTRSPVTGKYEWMKYSDVRRRAQHLGSALVNSGLKPSNESFVGVFASNRVEFFLMLFACAGYSMVLVPLYDVSGPEYVKFIIEKVDLTTVVANSNTNATLVLEAAKQIPSLKAVVIMDSPTQETRTLAKDTNIHLSMFSEFEAMGKANVKEFVFPGIDDLFCVPFTSGTTGLPKGVMLTHRNAVSCLSSLVVGYGKAGIYGGTIISYLPPAHLYEIMNQIASLYFARRIAFYSGDIQKLFEEVRLLKPNILPLVPRLMNALYTKVYDELKLKKWKKTLFEFALSRRENGIKKGVFGKNTIWDKLVFKKIQEVFGGNIDLIITTSAPLSAEVLRFFRCAAGCYVFEAYGQTEVIASTFTNIREYEGGHVGAPLPCNHIKLTDVPEMGYYAENDEGEICFKGPNVCKGYFKLPEVTKELMTDGWLHSGDIGKWQPNGTLKIIDRKKNLFKLAQGEYIAPEKIECVYSRCALVLQIFVEGFTDKEYTVAVVVPDPKVFPSWLKRKGFSSDKEGLLKDKGVRTAFIQELRAVGEKNHLNSLEQVRNLYLTEELFSLENDLLTPTFKLKRNKARSHFRSIIQKLYDEEPLAKSQKQY